MSATLYKDMDIEIYHVPGLIDVVSVIYRTHRPNESTMILHHHYIRKFAKDNPTKMFNVYVDSSVVTFLNPKTFVAKELDNIMETERQTAHQNKKVAIVTNSVSHLALDILFGVRKPKTPTQFFYRPR